MKIAVDARPLAHGANGISRYLGQLLPRLVDAEHQWYLYSDRQVQPAYEGLRDNVVMREGTILRTALSTPFAQYMFPRWARADGIDLFWSPRHHLPLAARSPKKLLTVHDLVWRAVPETMVRLGHLTERLLMPPSLQQADAIVVPSNSTAADIHRYYPDSADKVHVTPLASTLSGAVTCTSPPAVGEPVRILMVGTLEPRKNTERVLDAFLRLRQDFSTVELTLAGGPGWKSGPLRESLQQLRDRQVKYLGPVDDQQLQKLYTSAHFVVAPSLYEGFGLPVVEALAFGKPVVTANISAMVETTGAAGLLVDPHSVDQIYNAMRQLIESSSTYRQLSDAAVLQGKQYSWQKTAEATRLIIDQLAV